MKQKIEQANCWHPKAITQSSEWIEFKGQGKVKLLHMWCPQCNTLFARDERPGRAE